MSQLYLVKFFVSLSSEKHENLIAESVSRLLKRASNSRGLSSADLQKRVAAGVKKYVLEPMPPDVNAYVDELKVDDLCLIIACERGDEKAWEDLVANFSGTVKSAARSIAPNAEEAEDLAASIWAELYGLRVREDGSRTTKLAYYSGRGSLAGWLRAVVNQLAIDGFRKQSKFVQIEESREFENLANDAVDKNKTIHSFVSTENPEDQLGDKRATNDLETALRHSVGELENEDKLLMKLYYFDGMNLKQAGAILGFHEATASRRIAKIQKDLRAKLVRFLMEEKGWKESEVAESLREVSTKLNVNLEQVLTAILLVFLSGRFWQI